MNNARLILAAIRYRPLPHVLHGLLMALASGLIVLMLQVSHQLQARAERDAAGVDLVLGAPGSPLQLVLSAVYQLDVPTGNIPLAAVNRWGAHPMVAQAVPLAMGDSVGGFRIIGTTPDYLGLHGGTVATGRLWQHPQEAVVGAEVAAAGLTLDRRLVGQHGLAEGGEAHDHRPYRVVGVLAPTGTVLDRLILTGLDSVWALHGADAHQGDHDDHDAHAHDHDHDHDADHDDPADAEVTAALLRFRTPLAAAVLPRAIADEGVVMAARPAQELLRLRVLAELPIRALQGLAVALVILAALAMLVALNSALETRQYDLAIMRALGASRWRLVRLLWLEAAALALAGTLLGTLLAHAATAVIGAALPGQPLQGSLWLPAEALVPLLALVVASLAVVLPGWRAFHVDVATTLSRA